LTPEFVLARHRSDVLTGIVERQQTSQSIQTGDGDDVVTPDRRAHDERRVAEAVDLAGVLVREASVIDGASSRSDRRRRRRLSSLVGQPATAEFTVRLTDEVSRLPIPARAARRFAGLVDEADLSAFSLADRVMLRAGAALAPRLPRVVMPIVQRRLRAEAAGVILPATDPAFADHVATRAGEGYRCNINVLGEAIIGGGEAQRRLAAVIERIRRPDVDYVSVKISAVCASIDVLAFDDTVARVAERLRPLFRAAAESEPAKFVNLDMEEYADLELTIAVFRELLDEPEFEHLDAGIVLQAYLPDVRAHARELAEWAAARHRRSGGRIKVRLVKGANLAMEIASAELAGWTPAPFDTKHEVDANYKAVLDVLCAADFDDCILIGVASHNLFDVAWALGIRDELVTAGRPDRIGVEMLEGMSPSQSTAVRAVAGELVMYTPVVARRDFPAAIAYLVRRLDENTAPENFLAHVFELAGNRRLFDREAQRFAASAHARHTVDADTRRRQDRRRAPESRPLDEPFENTPDTDWTRGANRAWIAEALSAVPEAAPQRAVTVADADAAVATAAGAQASWWALGSQTRAAIIDRVGERFEHHRGRALAVMAAEAGKTVRQGDPEVSEAVDFAHYYARQAQRLGGVEGAVARPRGTVVVTPPWNFPLAIPAGGVLAALAAGNTVVLKPAPQTVRTARLIAELCWDAGVPTDVLQFVPAADDAAGRRLVTHPDVDAVILTGAAATADMFHRWRPDLRLQAETSGKNALVISATADVDEAVADLVASAFGHAGQKCSAASLAIVEAPLYDDRAFLERVRDAAATLRIGTPAEPSTDVGPLIEQPGEALTRALTTVDVGERWLLRPECRSDDRRLWSPGVRVGVRRGSWFARTECFGPVLGITRAADLDDAIRIQNDNEYGLTAGLHALDPAEIEHWVEHVDAGNLYVNRGITGAIVQRQPFGGWKRSVVGPAAKAGGPNYVATLCRWSDDASTASSDVAQSFERWWKQIGSVGHDATRLTVERNEFRYRPLPGGVFVRFGTGATDRQRAIVTAAAAATGCRLVVSEESEEADLICADRIADVGVDRYRAVGVALETDVAIACHRAGVSVDDAEPVAAPEIELPRWLREQAVTVTMHRHGRVATAVRPTSSVSPMDSGERGATRG